MPHNLRIYFSFIRFHKGGLTLTKIKLELTNTIGVVDRNASFRVSTKINRGLTYDSV